MRLITTLTKPEGGRINGTALEDDVYAQIQTGEALFLTDCNISEVDYYVYYQPLINSDGSVIGAIEVATPMQNVKDYSDCCGMCSCGGNAGKRIIP